MSIFRKCQKIIQEINSFDFSMLDDSDLSGMMDQFRSDLVGGCPPDALLPQIFAVISEVIDRRLGIWELFDEEEEEKAGKWESEKVGERGRWIDESGLVERTRAVVREKRLIVDDSRIHLDADFYRIIREKRQPGDGLTFWPYDVQLMGALALYDGRIAEMGTGEGKTLVAVFPASLWALCGKKVHIATVNDYLALRDCMWMGPVFGFLGLSVDCILEFMSDAERRQAYKADVVYGNNYEFGFDYLRDNLKSSLEDRVQGKLEYVIIDEIDSILMDEATTPLIISGAPERNEFEAYPYWKFRPAVELLLEKQNELVERFLLELKAGDDFQSECIKLVQIAKADPWNTELHDYLSKNTYAVKGMRSIEGKFAAARSEYKLEDELFYVVDERHETLKLTDKGIALVESQLGQGFMVLSDASNERAARSTSTEGEEVRDFLQLLRAYILHRRDEDYIVHNNRVIIVDEFTGRLAFGKQYEEGLHQAIECKEGLQITPENRVLGRITHPNYFRLYEKMTGMTATAHTEATEFRKLYNLGIVRVPNNKPVIRADFPDRFYRTEEEKLESIIDEIEECYIFGRPVLVGTRSVEKSEHLSALLSERGISHNTLNAKNHAQEAEIIKSAGQPYAVTIATNMAGRGTDIALGADLFQTVIGNYVKYLEKELESGTQRIQVDVYSQFEYDMLMQNAEYLDLGARHPGLSTRLQNKSYSARKLESAVQHNAPGGALYSVDFGLGLYVIGSERHGARRIDDQLRGRSGRQGDPGSSRFYLSLQDDLFRIFGREKISAMSKALARMSVFPELERAARQAQWKSEETSYHVRKYLIERGDINDRQRKTIYKMREEILSNDGTDDQVHQLMTDFVDDLMNCGKYVDADRHCDEWNLNELRVHCTAYFGVRIPDLDLEMSVDEVRDLVLGSFERTYDKRERVLGSDLSRRLFKAAMMEVLESTWCDYLSFQGEFDRSFLLRSYVKGDIMTDYRRESGKLFDDLLASIRREALRDIFTYPLPGERVDSLRRETLSSVSRQVKELLSMDPYSGGVSDGRQIQTG